MVRNPCMAFQSMGGKGKFKDRASHFDECFGDTGCPGAKNSTYMMHWMTDDGLEIYIHIQLDGQTGKIRAGKKL